MSLKMPRSHSSLNNKFASAVEAAVHEIQSLNDNITKDCIAPFVAPYTEHIITEDSITDKMDVAPTDDQQALFNIGNEEIIADSELQLHNYNVDEMIQ